MFLSKLAVFRRELNLVRTDPFLMGSLISVVRASTSLDNKKSRLSLSDLILSNFKKSNPIGISNRIENMPNTNDVKAPASAKRQREDTTVALPEYKIVFNRRFCHQSATEKKASSVALMEMVFLDIIKTLILKVRRYYVLKECLTTNLSKSLFLIKANLSHLTQER